MTAIKTPPPGNGRVQPSWRNLALLGSLLVMGLLIWGTQIYLTHSFSESEASKDRIRATLYGGGIQSTLQRHEVVPLLLSRDPILEIPLHAGKFTQADERLADFQKELRSGAIFLLNSEGDVVAASDDRERGTYNGDKGYYIAAIAGTGTAFTILGGNGEPYEFYYARKLTLNERLIGVIVVTVDLSVNEARWRNANDKVLVSDANNSILLASDPRWQGRTVAEVVSSDFAGSVVRRIVRSAETRIGDVPYVYIERVPHLAQEVPVGIGSWRLTYFDTLSGVRARVNAILAFTAMVLALLVALAFYLLSRRAQAHNIRIQKESNELRQLNQRLSREITTRKKAEKNLKEAEQSLEQASKLAALGQMSAAVSHELNQPLAAMKTYLAGARLLLKRRRPDEALTSFQRIDTLIDRMGSITRQLKSYARKRDVELETFDLRDSVREALSMMSPQLGKMAVAISSSLPSEPVTLHADPIRIEQIIVNLLRNALDAVRNQKDRQVGILLVMGESVILSIQDNGSGLEDPDKLFEPFYTTKKPGEGLGLGLAISAGFAAELGGRLVARNSPDGGAVFELILPRNTNHKQAAE